MLTKLAKRKRAAKLSGGLVSRSGRSRVGDWIQQPAASALTVRQSGRYPTIFLVCFHQGAEGFLGLPAKKKYMEKEISIRVCH